jgi:tetratricopeptide (TPR) repeat protein
VAPLSQAELRTTHGTIALLNLQAQIEGLVAQAEGDRLTLDQQVSLIQLIVLRGQLLSQIADYTQAAQLAAQLVNQAPTDGYSFLARAKTQAVFHRFSEALADLHQAERLGLSGHEVEMARASIFQAIGRMDEAWAIYQQQVAAQPSLETFGALAVIEFERGEIGSAEQWFAQAQECYRGTSPLPLAWLHFQQGHQWFHAGDLSQAQIWLSAAIARFPAYAPAQGHLAEVEAALGNTQSAIARLQTLAATCDDPDYAAQLSRILLETGEIESAQPWREKAANRYGELVAAYPEAFADHAAGFWLTIGADPPKALQLAEKNLEIRQTPRAFALREQAAIACRSEGVGSRE